MMDEGKEIRFVDLFAGIGGFHLGLTETASNLDTEQPREKGWGQDEAGFNAFSGGANGDGWRKHPFNCVFANEWDKYAASVYRKRFPETPLSTDDIRKVNAEDIPDHDLLCAGFPCQAFSVAGKRRGFEDTRGTLFYEIARIARAKRPRLLLLENVKGLLSHDEGRTFGTILRALDDLGYHVEWQVLNSKNFGVPQNRERVFIVGYSGEQPTGTVFPITKVGGLPEEECAEDLPTLTAVDYKGPSKQRDKGLVLEQIGNLYENKADAGRVYSSEGIARTLKGESGGLGGKMGLYQIQPLKFLNRNQKNFGDEAMTVDTVNSTGIRIMGKDYSNAVDSSGYLREGGHHPEDHRGAFAECRIRRLTPVECERLQGFPDGWTEFGYAKGKIVATEPIYGWVEEELNEDDDELWEGEPVKVWKVIGEKPLEKPIMDAVRISDTQRYKCLGNAVTVNVIRFLGERIEEI